MNVISKAKIKFVQSLKHKKYRQKHEAYCIEGEKACKTVIEAGHLPDFVIYVGKRPPFIPASVTALVAAPRILKEISTLNTPSELLGVFHLDMKRDLMLNQAKGNVILFLDRIQDPGNLGTIIRTADWYGLQSLILSSGCVDLYNPKTIQATMGCHVNFDVYYAEIGEVKSALSNHLLLALDMNGVPIERNQHQSNPIILAVGNEGQGLADEIVKLADTLISIPGHPQRIAESLNAAIAAAISLDRLM